MWWDVLQITRRERPSTKSFRRGESRSVPSSDLSKKRRLSGKRRKGESGKSKLKRRDGRERSSDPERGSEGNRSQIGVTMKGAGTGEEIILVDRVKRKGKAAGEMQTVMISAVSIPGAAGTGMIGRRTTAIARHRAGEGKLRMRMMSGSVRGRVEGTESRCPETLRVIPKKSFEMPHRKKAHRIAILGPHLAPG